MLESTVQTYRLTVCGVSARSLAICQLRSLLANASVGSQIVMNVPFTAVHFATYESAKTAMSRWAGMEQEEETLLVQLLAGAL